MLMKTEMDDGNTPSVLFRRWLGRHSFLKLLRKSHRNSNMKSAFTITLAPNMAPRLHFWHTSTNIIPQNTSPAFFQRSLSNKRRHHLEINKSHCSAPSAPETHAKQKENSQPPKVFDRVVKHHHSGIITKPRPFQEVPRMKSR